MWHWSFAQCGIGVGGFVLAVILAQILHMFEPSQPPKKSPWMVILVLVLVYGSGYVIGFRLEVPLASGLLFGTIVGWVGRRRRRYHTHG